MEGWSKRKERKAGEAMGRQREETGKGWRKGEKEGSRNAEDRGRPGRRRERARKCRWRRERKKERKKERKGKWRKRGLAAEGRDRTVDAAGGRRRGSGEESGVEAREKEKVREERGRESCVFPGCSSRGGVKTLPLRQWGRGRPILRRCDSLHLAFLEASPPRKNRRKKRRRRGSGPRPLAPRSLFFAFREPLRGQWHIRGRRERRGREIDKLDGSGATTRF